MWHKLNFRKPDKCLVCAKKTIYHFTYQNIDLPRTFTRASQRMCVGFRLAHHFNAHVRVFIRASQRIRFVFTSRHWCVNALDNILYIMFLFTQNKQSRGFIKLSLSHWSHMEYFMYFSYLSGPWSGSCIGSLWETETSQTSSKIS